MPFVIRPAVAADRPIVRTFVTATLLAYQLDAAHDDLAAFGIPFNGALAELVADEAGLPIGMATLYPRGRGVGWVSKLFVDPDHRRKGIGKALLEAIVLEARGWKLQRVGLSTLPRLRDAVRLYESSGWVRGHDEHGRASDRVYWLDLSRA